MIKGYARYRRTMLCSAAAACAVFSVVMLIYGMNFTDILYANGVYLFIIAAFVVFDLFRYRAKTSRLLEISRNLTHTIHEYPDWENNIEQLYSGIIASIYDLMATERAEIISQYSEQVDYYTMWLHQIKTPISAMRLAIESDSEANPVYEQELFKIERYVEMALQYLKIKNLETDLVLSDCDIDGVISRSIKKYKTLFIYKNLSVDFEKTGLILTTDEKWLSFIVEQILSNAIKYTVKGGLKIYRAENGFSIEDSGIGIRPEDIERIFEKGYTGFNGRLDNRASGLGLYMAGNIAKRLGITLGVSSTVGKGTIMTVVFPPKNE